MTAADREQYLIALACLIAIPLGVALTGLYAIGLLLVGDAAATWLRGILL